MLGRHLWTRQIAGQAAVGHYRLQPANGQLSGKNGKGVKQVGAASANRHDVILKKHPGQTRFTHKSTKPRVNGGTPQRRIDAA
jgi:hypothetical protein